MLIGWPEILPPSTADSEATPQASTAEEPSTSSTNDNVATSGPAISEKAQKIGPVLTVPSSTSSQTNKDPSPTSPPLTGATATNDTASVGRDLGRSFLRKKRDAGKSSSRRAPQPQRDLESDKESAPAFAQTEGAARAQKKSSFNFLSFLNCCSVHQPTNTMDMDDQAIPAKKSRLQPVREKPDDRTESGKAVNDTENVKDSEVKDALEEKQASKEENEGREATVPAETNPVSDTRPQLARRESSSEKPNVRAATPVPAETAETAAPIQDQPLPPILPEIQPSLVAPISTQGLQVPAVNVQAPTPTIDQERRSPTPERTPNESEGNSDVEMPDAPTDVEEVVEHEIPQAPAPPKVEAPKSELPPPPPIEQRQPEIRTQDMPALPDSSEDKQVWLLPPVQPQLRGRKCLVLDLDETLVHSSFKILNQADFTIPVEIEGQYHNVYVIKRPGVDAFMKRVGELYEVVVFTASVSKYGDPLLDQLDIHHVVHHRLFRESCYNHQGNYVKVAFQQRPGDSEFANTKTGPLPSRA